MTTKNKAQTAQAQAGSFTPGPWKYERAGYGWCILTQDFDEETSTGSCIGRLSDLMPEGDARLIASAPDLLAERDNLKELLLATQRAAIECAEQRDELKAALEECQKAMGKVRNDPYTTCACAEQLALAERSARAAINKVKGQP